MRGDEQDRMSIQDLKDKKYEFSIIDINSLIVVWEAHLPENLCYEAHNHFVSPWRDANDKIHNRENVVYYVH